MAAAVFAALDASHRLLTTHVTTVHGWRPARYRGDSTAALRPLLTGERVALNFLQRLSGIASATARLVDLSGPIP